MTFDETPAPTGALDPDLRFCLLACRLGLVERRRLEGIVARESLADPAGLRAVLTRLAGLTPAQVSALESEANQPGADHRLEALLADLVASLAESSSPTAVEVTALGAPFHEPSRVAPDVSWTVTAECPGRYAFEADDRDRAEIGRGGIGRVLLARDSHLGREIALKELLVPDTPTSAVTTGDGRVELSGAPPGVTRFLREAQVTGQLEHPGIVPVYELGARGDGTLYYTMRLLRGRTLQQALGGCRSLEDRLLLVPHLQNLCHAIAFAHSRGVIHRDLKPANVMLGEFGETVVLDWGLAKLRGVKDLHSDGRSRRAEVQRDATAGLTVEGTAVGTPHYMSPEQVVGEAAEIDERSDVWALGVILYQILTGVLPYSGSTPPELMRNILVETPVVPRQRQKKVPRELESICLRALDRDPGRRYPGARQLSDDLEAYRDGRPVGAHHYMVWEHAQRFAARHRAALVAGLATMAVIVVALGVVTASWTRERAARMREAEAHATERAQRLEASYRLSQGLDERAARLTREGALLDARVFAAAAWLANPAASGGDNAAELLARHPEAGTTVLHSRSRYFRASVEALATLQLATEAGPPLWAVALSPDGGRVAAGDEHGHIVIRDATSGQVLATLEAGAEVRDLAFAPDGRQLAAGTNTGELQLWDLDPRARRWLVAADRGETLAVAFTADGGLVLSGGRDGIVRLWEAADGRAAGELRGHDGAIHDLATSRGPGRGRAISASRDRTARVWDLGSRRCLHVLAGHGSVVRAVDLTPDGRRAATGSYDKTLRVWELPAGRPLLEAGGFEDEVMRVALTPDGQRVLGACWDGRLTVWDVTTAVPVIALTHQSPIWSCDLAGGTRMAAACEDGRLRIWQLASQNLVLSVPGQAYQWTIDHSPDGRHLASGDANGTVRVYDLATGRLQQSLAAHTDIVGTVAYSPDGTRLASCGFDGRVRIWEAASGRALGTLLGHEGAVRSLAWAPDGTQVASGGSDATVRTWDVATGRELQRLSTPAMVRSVAFAPDGSWLAAVGNSPVIRRWAGHQPLADLRLDSDVLLGLAVSPDGASLAVGDKHGQISLFATQDGRLSRPLARHRGLVYSLRYSPNGKYLLSSGDDRQVILWRTTDGAPELVLELSQSVTAIDFAADSRQIAVGDAHLVRLLPLDLTELDAGPSDLLRRAEREAGLRLDGFELKPR